MAESALFLGLASETSPLSRPLPGGRCVMHGEDKESQRRGTERGGEGRMDLGRRWRVRVDQRSSIKPAVNFQPSCGDTKKGKGWIKYDQYN